MDIVLSTALGVSLIIAGLLLIVALGILVQLLHEMYREKRPKKVRTGQPLGDRIFTVVIASFWIVMLLGYGYSIGKAVLQG